MIFSMNQSNVILPVPTLMIFVAIFLITTIPYFFMVVFICNNRGRMLGTWILVWLVVGAFLLGSGVFGRFIDVETANSKIYTQKELLQDLKELENYIMEENPLYFTNKDVLQQSFLDTYEKIEDGMTELEFYRLINPIVVAVNCGHTNLSLSEALMKNRENTGKFFPLKVTLVDNQLYVLEDDPENGIYAGDKILSINGNNNEEILQKLMKNISSDSNNKAKPHYIISKHFNSRFHDFVDNSDLFHVVLEDKKGNEKTAELQAKFRKQFNTTAWSLHFAEYQDGDYYSSKIFKDYGLLTIRIFMEEKGNKFDAFLEEFFLKLREENISKLVIDLRGNYGGSPFMAQTLLSHLITEEIAYFQGDFPLDHRLAGFQKPISPVDIPFTGQVVILIDGAGFSTTGHLCALMKYHNLGTFVGSETSGSYVCTDRSRDAILKHTRMRLHYSTGIYEVAVSGFQKNRGIQPDIYIEPTIEDLLNHRDVQMKQALKVLGL